jgi:hypothetical protein
VDLAGSAQAGVAGRKARTGRRSGDRRSRRRLIETLKTGCTEDSQHGVTKVTSGGAGDEPEPRSPTNPEGAKASKRGYGGRARLIPSSMLADHRDGEDLEVDAPGTGAGSNTGRGLTPTARRDEAVTSRFYRGGGRKPLEQKTRDVGAG